MVKQEVAQKIFENEILRAKAQTGKY